MIKKELKDLIDFHLVAKVGTLGKGKSMLFNYNLKMICSYKDLFILELYNIHNLYNLHIVFKLKETLFFNKQKFLLKYLVSNNFQ